MSKVQLFAGLKRVPQDFIPEDLEFLFGKIYYDDFKDGETKGNVGSELNQWQFVPHAVKELMFYAYQKGQADGFKDCLRLMADKDKPLVNLKKLKVSKV
jgi:hypothetical protein